MKKISTMQAFSNEILKEQKLTIGIDQEIAGRSIVFWMKQAKSFLNRKLQQHRKR